MMDDKHTSMSWLAAAAMAGVFGSLSALSVRATLLSPDHTSVFMMVTSDATLAEVPAATGSHICSRIRIGTGSGPW